LLPIVERLGCGWFITAAFTPDNLPVGSVRDLIVLIDIFTAMAAIAALE
jgi:hypothetical protein